MIFQTNPTAPASLFGDVLLIAVSSSVPFNEFPNSSARYVSTRIGKGFGNVRKDVGEIQNEYR